MFRDETVKVERRVRASWGMTEATSSSTTPTTASSHASRGALAKTKRSASTPPNAKPGTASIPTPPASVLSTSPISAQSPQTIKDGHSPVTPHPAELFQDNSWEALALHSPIAANPNDLGVSFYVNHYILGYPDEVKRGEDLNGELWFQNPAPQATMAALGLAGLGNLHNDKQLQHLSRVKYGEALACTNQALRDPLKNLDAAIRATIMLALYQVMSVSHRFALQIARSRPQRHSLTAVPVRAYEPPVS